MIRDNIKGIILDDTFDIIFVNIFDTYFDYPSYLISYLTLSLIL